MIFKQSEQVLGLTLPLKGQTRRIDFPYELARQLWKYGWSYPKPRAYQDGWILRPAPGWDRWQEIWPITIAYFIEANRILAEHVVTLPVQPGRGKKAVGRIRIKTIRRERLGDISDRDCISEGVGYTPQHSVTEKFVPFSICPICRRLYPTPQKAYTCLWSCCGGNWERDEGEDVWVLDWREEDGQEVD